MNAGIVASRYAKALLKYVKETGNAEELYSQTIRLFELFRDVPALKEAVEMNPGLSLDRKITLLETALNAPLADAMKRFVELIDSRSRMSCFSRILVSFIDQYREDQHVKVGKLVTSVPQEGLKERMEEMLGVRTGGTVALDERVDGSLIGGFVLELGDLRLDASVAGQFKRIRKDLIENDNRII